MLEPVLIGEAGALLVFLLFSLATRSWFRFSHPGVYDMPIAHRSGRRIPPPYSRQIRHELILIWVEDEIPTAGIRK
jgi:hypothetical protein